MVSFLYQCPFILPQHAAVRTFTVACSPSMHAATFANIEPSLLCKYRASVRRSVMRYIRFSLIIVPVQCSQGQQGLPDYLVTPCVVGVQLGNAGPTYTAGFAVAWPCIT